MKNVVALLRVSTKKQRNDNDSVEQQLQEVEYFLGKKPGWKLVKHFGFAESGSKDNGERRMFGEMMDYCLDRKNDVDVVLVRNISRLTRDGWELFISIKRKLESEGISVLDIIGVISDEKVNTLERLGLEYKWSVYGKTEKQEMLEAEEAKSERRKILTQLIGAEAGYTQMGYYHHPAPYGFVNRVEETTEHGKRAILVEVKEESLFIKKAFDLAESGMTFAQVTKQLGLLGARSRSKNIRDPNTGKIIGRTKPEPLGLSVVERMLKRPTYVGVIRQAWTRWQPVKAQFPGFISVEQFNRVNQGVQKIVFGEDGRVEMFFGKECGTTEIKKSRSRYNPLYPFKSVIRCPVCGSKFLGSGSRTRGKLYPQYHCHKGHKTWSMKAGEFNEKVKVFVSQIRLSNRFLALHDAIFYEEYDLTMEGTRLERNLLDKELKNLEVEQQNVYQNIKITFNPTLRNQLEKDFDGLEERIKVIRHQRDEREEKETDIKKALRQGQFLIEHLEKLLIDSDNIRRQEQLFGLLFDEFPTFDEMINRTAKLSPLFAYKDDVEVVENPCLWT